MTHSRGPGESSWRFPVVGSIDEVRRSGASARRRGLRVGLVPTMGALHAGHLSLVAACTRECGYTVVSIFVNPTQFGPREDFASYPRSLSADCEKLAEYAVGLVFAPANEEVYRPGHSSSVEVEGLTDVLEGLTRPGHFRGVATVVLKLFNIVSPDAAYFGHKDYQQSVVIRRMVADFDLPIEIKVCPTVREPDGLALSSRNAYLTADERGRAVVLSKSLELAEELMTSGQSDAGVVVAQMRRLMDATPGLQLDYAAIVDPETLAPVSRIEGPVIAAVAARVGATRLIDNRLVEARG